MESELGRSGENSGGVGVEVGGSFYRNGLELE